MKKSLLTLLTVSMLSMGTNAQQTTTPEKEINPDQDGISKEEASVKLEEFGTKALEVGKQVGEAILLSIDEATLTQTLDAQDGKAELSYSIGAQGAISTLITEEEIKDEIVRLKDSIAEYEDEIQNKKFEIDNHKKDIILIEDKLSTETNSTLVKMFKNEIKHQENMINIIENGIDWRQARVDKKRNKLSLITNVKITPKAGLYGIEIAFNAISNENLLVLQEAYIHSLGIQLEGKFGELSAYTIGLRSSRYESETVAPIQITEFVLGGIEYELHIRLTDDGKVKLLLAAGIETGLVTEKTGDGLYLNTYADVGIQIGNLVIEAMIEARATGGTTLDNPNEYLNNSGYIQPSLKLTYEIDDTFALQGGIRYNTATQRTSFDLGVRVSPDFSKIFKKKD